MKIAYLAHLTLCCHCLLVQWGQHPVEGRTMAEEEEEGEGRKPLEEG